MKIYKSLFALLLIVTFILCGCSSNVITNSPSNTTILLNSNSPIITETFLPTTSPTTQPSESKSFNLTYPMAEIERFPDPGIIEEMTGNYLPYVVFCPISYSRADFFGGYKNCKWYDEWNFYYNNKNYVKMVQDLWTPEGIDHEKEETLTRHMEGTKFTSALINEKTILKLYSKSGYVGEYKPGPLKLGWSQTQDLIVWCSDIDIKIPFGMVVGISKGDPFPRKPIYQNDGRSFEIDLNNDGEMQKVIFHKIDADDNYYNFKIVVELIAYNKSYILTTLHYYSTQEEKEKPVDNPDVIFEFLSDIHNIDILPVDLNNDGKMELVCYESQINGNIAQCSVYSFDDGKMFYVNGTQYGH